MTAFRLEYKPDAYDGKFASIRYPSRQSPGFSSRRQAELALAAMPDPARMQIVETEE